LCCFEISQQGISPLSLSLLPQQEHYNQFYSQMQGKTPIFAVTDIFVTIFLVNMQKIQK